MSQLVYNLNLAPFRWLLLKDLLARVWGGDFRPTLYYAKTCICLQGVLLAIQMRNLNQMLSIRYQNFT